MPATPIDTRQIPARPVPLGPGSRPGRPRLGRRRRRPIAASAASAASAVAVTAVLLAALVAGAPAPVAAAGEGEGDPTVVVTGRGWGHGRGMGQYGALGYTQDFGWTSAQILDHFYGGTVAGPAPAGGPVDPARLEVDLVALRGLPTTVALADGTLHLMDETGSTLTRRAGAIRLTPIDGRMAMHTAPSCDGPWAEAPPLDRPVVRVAAETGAGGPDGLLQVCSPAGRTWYAGEVWATTTAPGAGGSPRTVNLVTVEEYLRGVIPNEVPASWPAATLEAQAVAARSYVMAGDRRWQPWADTCDTTPVSGLRRPLHHPAGLPGRHRRPHRRRGRRHCRARPAPG